MGYVLNGTSIRAPHQVTESNDTQVAQNRAMDGSINRDYFGSNKRTWKLNYNNVKGAEYNTIKSIYDTYLNTGSAVTWEITETNYTVSQTNVHMDLDVRDFRTRGEDYISDFTLILIEA